ncbi:MAG: WbqC family protein, partial [Pseudomonadota bacterium]|nr:WbqC family protein [Pseudomonadota bacterium]
NWAPNHFTTLRHAYRQASFFSAYAAELRRLFEAKWDRLADLDSATLEFLRDAFGIRTPLERSSQLAVEGARAEMILNICRAVGADTLLAGMGGSRGYLDAEQFARAGVRIVFHDFRHPEYPQCGAAPFIRGLSALDMLFNCGPQSRGLLLAEPARRTAALRPEFVASAQA